MSVWMLFDVESGNALDFTDKEEEAKEWKAMMEEDETIVVVEWEDDKVKEEEDRTTGEH